MEDGRTTLCQSILHWNKSRLEMFTISQPDENMEFHGIVRFFHQDPSGRCTTKCIRLSSNWIAYQLIGELIKKFRLDAGTQFTLWEVRENGEERKLDSQDRPLLVQLDWDIDGQEGQFWLRQENILETTAISNCLEHFRRGQPKRFSKNDRKKRQRHKERIAPMGSLGRQSIGTLQELEEDDKYYQHMTFTRTLSNPEIVLKRRREQKLVNKLHQIGNGGTLKIYGVELFPNRPYISLLVGIEDNAQQIVQMAMKKYGMDALNSEAFGLVEIFLNEPDSGSYNDLRGVEKKHERYLRDDECPLKLLVNLSDFANLVFFLRRRPSSFPTAPLSKSITMPDFTATTSSAGLKHSSWKRNRSASTLDIDIGSTAMRNIALLPCLVPINEFASSANFGAAALAIQPGITEIGSSSICAIQLRAPSVLPRHCCLLYRQEQNSLGRDHRVQVSLLDKSALVEMDGASICSVMDLHDGVQLRIGGVYCYRFFGGVQHQQSHEYGCDSTAYQSKSAVPAVKVEDTQSVPAAITCQQGGTFGPCIFPSAGHPRKSFDRNSLHEYLPPLVEEVQPESFTASTNSEGGGYVDFERKETKEEQGQMIVLNGNSIRTTMPVGAGYISSHLAPIQQGHEHTLPVLLGCLDQQKEDELFRFVLFDDCHRFGAFRLIPAFVLYSICRHRLLQSSCSWDMRQYLNRGTVMKFIDFCNRTVKAHLSARETLVFWLANSAELLNMLRSDAEMAQSVGTTLLAELAQLVQNIFSLFVESCRQHTFCGVQQALNLASLANPNNEVQAGPLMAALDDCLRIVRWALLNPALTIQMFSQLFHFISASIFNWLVLSPEARPFISFMFGFRLKQLHQQIQGWAQRQGLELAAECHMDLIAQTINLLTTPKSIEQIAALGATCYKLNSIQVRYLLENYVGDIRNREAPTVSREIVEHICALARQHADQLLVANRDGQLPLELAETNYLQLPFLIPQDGYVVEKLRGIPPDMAAFMNALQQRALVQVLLQHSHLNPIAEMSWNVFLSTIHTGANMKSTSNVTTMFPPMPPIVPPHHKKEIMAAEQPTVVYAEVKRQNEKQRCASASILHANENHQSRSPFSQEDLFKQQWNERMIEVGAQKKLLVQKVTIKRAPNEGLGLSIVEMGTPGHANGIYVKTVIAGSPAEKDGRIAAGDQLLSVNGQSLLGVQQEMAAQKIVSSGPVVHLELAKKAAQLNGIASYLQGSSSVQPSQQPFPKAKQPPIQSNLGHPSYNSPQQPTQKLIEIGSSGQITPKRPMSATGLLYVQAETASTSDNTKGNIVSLRNPVICGTPCSVTMVSDQQSTQSPNIQHSQQSSSSSLAQPCRLPAHYKPAANRPQIVLQPTRPASSSPLNSRRSQTDSSNRSTPTHRGASVEYQHQMEENLMPDGMKANGRNNLAIASPYPQLLTRDHHRMGLDSPPINSSTTTSTGSTATVEREWLLEKGTIGTHQKVDEPILPATDEATSSPSKHNTCTGRLSAPLFGAEQPKEGKEPMEQMQDLERKLDELDSAGSQMSAEDQKCYRKLLERMARMKREQNHLRSQSAARLPPSMMAAAQQLERQSKSLAALSLDPGRAMLPLSSSMEPKTTKNGNNNLLTISKPIGESEHGSRNNEMARDLLQEITEVVVRKKQPPAVPAKPAIRELRPPAPLLMAPFDSSAKKRVQFSVQNNENFSSADAAQNVYQKREEPKETNEEEEEEDEPRAQIVGAHEVYMNDPRQRRLQELQISQKMLRPVMDSSALGFREKMRMFAEHLGERELSSNTVGQPSMAQRQIQQRN